MIRRFGGLVITSVTIDAGHSQGRKLQPGGRFVTLGTVGDGVFAIQREPCQLVQTFHVPDNPGLRRMASSAVGTDSLVVHVGMAGGTFRSSLFEFQGRMAAFAGNRPMLAGQAEPGTPMVEGDAGHVHLPAAAGMAGGTVRFQTGSVG